MAEVRGVLGQANPVAATLTPLYTVGANTDAIVSSLVICERSGTPTDFRISVAPLGAADSSEQYIFFDHALTANQTIDKKLGITLATTDVIRVYATLATVSFTAFGLKIDTA